jgi:hypothetical protein
LSERYCSTSIHQPLDFAKPSSTTFLILCEEAHLRSAQIRLIKCIDAISASATETGDTTMLINTKIAFAVALIVGTASAALAGDQTDERGGYVMPGSMDGVNQVHHSDIFGNAGKAYGRVESPTQRSDFYQSRKTSHDR